MREILEGKASAQSRCDLNSVGLKNHMQSNSMKNNPSSGGEQGGRSSFRRSKHSSSAEGMSSGSDCSDEDTLAVLKFESDK